MATIPFAIESPWRRSWTVALAAICGYALWLLLWYRETVASMVSIWYRSDTFAHGFVILPIALWLIWRKRHELSRVEPQPGVFVLPILALVLAGGLWLLGDLGDVLAARQFAWITLLVAGIWLLVGNAVARRIAFPLAYLYFAVPVGEFLLPTMIEWTADFTVAALRASGVPVLRDGMTFQIPTGSWSVVEACSGLRYLIASVTVGVLYAYVMYRSASRRIAFVIASLLLPIVANWLRAYMIVMIGHLSSNRLAVGVDHVVYGWIFFGLVMLLLFWIGGFWREDQPTASPVAPATRDVVAANGMRWLTALGALAVVTVVAPAAVRGLHANDAHAAIDTTPVMLPGWNATPRGMTGWTPDFTPPRAAIASLYERGGETAGLYVAMYYNQDDKSKLVSVENQWIRTADKAGHVVTERRRTLSVDEGALIVDESVLRIRNSRIIARRWFWIDGEFTANPVRAKLLQIRSQLRGRGDSGAIIVTYARTMQGTRLRRSMA